ncbi:hypothetical protein WJX77_003664 [Trebouxia sp. C0004]
MTRVLLASTGECIGTAARIQQDGLTVSCLHVFIDGGNFLAATGWGKELAFVASSPHDDIVFLQGPSGEHFDMTEESLQIAMPNSSGSPVLDDTRSLRGVHIGTSYHLDEVHAQNQDSLAAPHKLETNVYEWWAEKLQPASAQEPSSSLNTASSDFDAMSLAQHACANIQHKAFVGMFVPHNRLLQILEGSHCT